MPGPDPRQHAPGDRLDRRRRADPRRHRHRHVRPARRHPQRARVEPRRPAARRPAPRPDTASSGPVDERAFPPSGKSLNDPGQRPAVRLALHVSRRRRQHAQQRLLLRGDGRAHRHDGHARDHAPRTSPLAGGSPSSAASSTPSPATRTTRGSRSRASGPARPSRPASLPRPVRRALRAQPREHGRPRPRGHARRSTRQWHRAPQARDRRRPTRRPRASGRSSSRGRGAGHRRVDPVRRGPARDPRPHDLMAATTAAPTTTGLLAQPVPQITAHRVDARAARLALAGSRTTDHKRIGIMYLVTTFVFFILGGVEALLIRLQLGAPENTLLSPQTYNQLFTMHGTTMVFLFVVPIMAGFGNYFIPLMIGARDMAFPKLNALSYWLLLAGGIVFYASLFFTPPEAGWTLLPAAVVARVRRQRRRRRVDLPHPPHRPELARRRDQLLRDDREHARARHGLGPPAAVRLDDPHLRGPADPRAAGHRGRRDAAADRPPLRDALLRRGHRAATRCCGSTSSGSSATPRSTS